jgi:ATP-dependent RNA helicase RhlE
VTFKELPLIEPILKALEKEGYVTPTPIQEKSIPAILNKQDLLGCAQTGTGKTAAFTIPILQLMSEQVLNGDKRKGIRTLILTPTRELAIQIGESIKAYGYYLPIKSLVIFGGVSQFSQVETLKMGVDILVATPGRLLDLMQQGYVSLQQIQFFVLDEADRMLDMGFVHDVKRVIARLPQKRQTLFFSATMPKEIQQLADQLLTSPVKVEVTPVSSTAEIIQQSVYFVERHHKKSLLLHILEDQSIETLLVFTQMKHAANKLAETLNKAGVTTEAIHGNKSQNARQSALENFKKRRTRVLVATDIAARGIDIDELTHVLNYELPNVPETYVHRIGRTGRAGALGNAISFCDNSERSYLNDIQKLINKAIPVKKGPEFPDVPFVKSEQGNEVRTFQRNNSHSPASNGGRWRNGNSNNRPSQPTREANRPSVRFNNQERSGKRTFN